MSGAAMPKGSASWGQAVRAATHRALAARERLRADYPRWEEWRRQVRAAKAQVVAQWRDYVALLRARVEGWGGQVIWARDAQAARQAILGVAKRHGVRRLVQSKSMTAHEIGLEPFLRRQGLQLTETDLGEFIIQLAGHPPAHLTAPALHLNRYQIADLLSAHLHLEAPTEPAALTQVVAAALASRYAEADMGITGVNFAAAPAGVLVCLENEGNLRLAACRPPVHLALMGWDKLAPALADLEACLRLLPASATGQRLTSLVHFFKGLKAGPWGTQAFYLVILDNGRSALAAHPELREALHCLRCGACLNICPVFQAGAAHLYGRVYPGAIGILLAPFLPPGGDISDLCSQCGSCKEVCPAGIDLPDKIRHLRRQAPSWGRAQALTAAAGVLLGRPRWYRALEGPAKLLVRKLFAGKMRELLGADLPEKSFFQGRQSPQTADSIAAGTSTPAITPAAAAPGAATAPAARWLEGETVCLRLAGPEALARHLAETARGEIWLADHADLAPLAQALQNGEAPVRLANNCWAPEADTVVTMGLGVIPELGTVLASGGQGPGDWLPFRARRQVVVAPAPGGDLDLAGALALSAAQDCPLVTWLTGPTRTADIEKILVLGAQGPAALTVVLYRPEPAGE